MKNWRIEKPNVDSLLKFVDWTVCMFVDWTVCLSICPSICLSVWWAAASAGGDETVENRCWTGAPQPTNNVSSARDDGLDK